MKAILKSDFQGILGTEIFDSGVDGPTVGLITQIHGNEYSGGQAVQDIRLIFEGSLRRGRVIVVTGNLDAAAAGRRFIDEDLNRVWTEEGLKGESKEASRARDLRKVFDAINVALDLHSVTSTPDAPSFGIVTGGTQNQLALANALDVPHHVCFEASTGPTACVSDYFLRSEKSCIALELGYESQVDFELARSNVLRFLAATEVIKPFDSPKKNTGQWWRLGQKEWIADLTSFQYDPNFVRQGFAPVQRGQVIAKDKIKDYLAESDGVLLFSKRIEDYQTGAVNIQEPFVYLAVPMELSETPLTKC